MSLVAMQTPSHRVTEKGDRVTVHGLELFVGHIDGFDDDDSEIKDLDSDAIDEIVKMTQRHMSAGSNPKLVLMHQDDNGSAPPESIGDIVSVYAKPISIRCSEDEKYEGAGIVGDVEMTKADFTKFLASNRYPRRSAEIWQDGHLSEVALLGRETPARPLRDTKFVRSGDKKVFTRPTTFAEVAPGGSNVYVPSGTGQTNDEEKKMPDILEHEEKEMLRKLRAENGLLNDELGKLKAQLDELENGDKIAFDDEEDEDEFCVDCDEEEKAEYQDEEDEDEIKAEFAKISKTKAGARVAERYARVRRERNIYKKRAEKLASSNRRTRFSRVLDKMESSGYSIKAHRAIMLDDLMSSKDPKAKVAFWKKTMRRAPLGKRLNTKNTRQRTKVNFSEDQRKTATAAAVTRMTRDKIDSSQYTKIFNEELQKVG